MKMGRATCYRSPLFIILLPMIEENVSKQTETDRGCHDNFVEYDAQF